MAALRSGYVERDQTMALARAELRLIEQWYGMTAGERAWRYTQVTSAERTVLQQSGGMAWARGGQVIERTWFRVYSREWRRLCILAMSDVDARERANRRWAALGDEAREVAPMSAKAAHEHKVSERWAGITVRGQ